MRLIGKCARTSVTSRRAHVVCFAYSMQHASADNRAASACIAQRSAPRGRGSGAAATFRSASSSWRCPSFCPAQTRLVRQCRLSSWCKSKVPPSRVAPSRRAAVRQCACASTQETWLRCVARGLVICIANMCTESSVCAMCICNMRMHKRIKAQQRFYIMAPNVDTHFRSSTRAL
eukprot:4311516-Pleurochrysis_carterae.AAC.5